MQKVITITTHTLLKGEDPKTRFLETEYPTLNKYLEDGYEIKTSIPILKESEASHCYAITFILEKKSRSMKIQG